MKSRDQLGKNPSFFRELVLFLAQSKKWYLIPVAIVILLMSAFVILAGTGAAPFIYTLF